MIPLMALLGFASWTLLLLLFTVGIYRWSRILTGKVAISRWKAEDLSVGGDFYQRAMRAHANCVENLPVFAALVLVQQFLQVNSPMIDILAFTVLAARIPHSLVHLAFRQTDPVVSLRFGFYFVQVIAMLALAGVLVADSLSG